MRARIAAILCGLLIAAPASAFTLDLPGEAERQTIAYTCSDSLERHVEYVNAGANSLAIVEIDGEPRLFVNVLSASGARYASGALEWWTKGRQATLRDERAANDAAPLTCDETEGER